MSGSELKIALAGNPNCGKTTLFNALTGSNQFVGNWPGVTVEKKEGRMKKYEGVIITDLPGIYSLSPYTLEEVVARNYLIGESPDAILNIVDGTNLERNLYLTTQLMELGIPVVIAINMMDVVRKLGDDINVKELSKKLGCPIVEISALKEDGIFEAVELAIEAAKKGKAEPHHVFSGSLEHAIAHIEEAAVHSLPEEQQRWYAIKIFERDEKVIEQLKLDAEKLAHIEKDIVKVESDMDDDAESVIINERYEYIASILKGCYKKKSIDRLTTSDKIDKVVTNRWLALPIFAAIMFLVYFISVTTVGTLVTDWTNDKLFGDGFHLFGMDGGYTEKAEEFETALAVVNGFIEATDADTLSAVLDTGSEHFDADKANAALGSAVVLVPNDYEFTYTVVDDETLLEETITSTGAELKEAAEIYSSYGFVAPEASEYGVWVMGIPALVERGLGTFECPEWLSGLILDGLIAGVGAVLGFVPQMLVLFLFLAFLEACGYMSRIAFVMDRVFRKLGLSGKSFIPMLVGTGCSVPGIMASRTIENVRDRRMTIITTTFIPCGAKLPFIAMITGAVFGGAWWVAPSAYFIGMIAIVISGIMLKKTKLFTGEAATFVMELPAYHMPTLKNLLYSMWERGWSFIKKAGTVILLSSVIIWFTTYFGFVDGSFRMLTEAEVSNSILAYVGRGIAWLFVPLGFGTWQKAIASITGFIAKENIVATMGIVYGGMEGIANSFIYASGLSFLVFNLLCAPCFAAMGAIRREMNSFKWTAFAITYQCVFAYAMALVAYQATLLITGAFTVTVLNIAGLVASVAVIAVIVYLLARPAKDIKGNKVRV